jgi:peptidoglycan/LPS O-acetylase OafA/YrhL
LLATRWFPVSFAQYALLPYVTVHLGRRQWRVAAAIRRLGDPSYGMYIYAFPIQQLIVLGLPGVSAPLLAAAAVPAAAAAGYASWHLIEARCLRAGRNFIHRRTDRLRVGVAPVPNA